MSKTSQPSVDDLPPTCKTCKHYIAVQYNAYYCGRAQGWEPVTGYHTKSVRCEYERGPQWPKWLGGKDKCGPEGKYWGEAPPRKPPNSESAISRPSR